MYKSPGSIFFLYSETTLCDTTEYCTISTVLPLNTKSPFSYKVTYGSYTVTHSNTIQIPNVSINTKSYLTQTPIRKEDPHWCIVFLRSNLSTNALHSISAIIFMQHYTFTHQHHIVPVLVALSWETAISVIWQITSNRKQSLKPM